MDFLPLFGPFRLCGFVSLLFEFELFVSVLSNRFVLHIIKSFSFYQGCGVVEKNTTPIPMIPIKKILISTFFFYKQIKQISDIVF